MFGLLQEIISTIRKNKLRTFLTGFSMAWGIFMLIVLLGSGNGLKNGVSSGWGNRPRNVIHMWSGSTSKPYGGFQKGHKVKFDDNDPQVIENAFDITSNATMSWGIRSKISHGRDFSDNTVEGVEPIAAVYQDVKILKGRFINDADIADERKVIVIRKKTADLLFRGDEPVGKYVKIDGVLYQVVGVYDLDGNAFNSNVYAPLSTLVRIYNPNDGYNRFSFMVDASTPDDLGEPFEKDIRMAMGRYHNFAADDKQALWIGNWYGEFLKVLGLFSGINLFIWIIGLGTLVAGIVGVSNIMLITVRERTHEFGIRKALGATPYSILRLIIVESLLITSSFGYIGVVAGVGVVQVMNSAFQVTPGQEATFFANPEVDLSVVLYATIVLIISGALAGYFPARKAVNVKPIEALNS